jgi:hypothetical protein
MNPRYQVGQEVAIKPPARNSLEPRDSALYGYAGQTGTITDYHWISPRFGEFFYIYRVKIASSDNEIIVHEDEIIERTSTSLKGK